MDQKFLQREEPYDQERDKGLNLIFKHVYFEFRGC